MYRVSFRIRRVYFDQIVAGTKQFEVRRASDFWRTRAERVWEELQNDREVYATFLVGRHVHRRKILAVNLFGNAHDALARNPSPQGLKDLGDGPVYRFQLGEALALPPSPSQVVG